MSMSHAVKRVTVQSKCSDFHITIIGAHYQTRMLDNLKQHAGLL